MLKRTLILSANILSLALMSGLVPQLQSEPPKILVVLNREKAAGIECRFADADIDNLKKMASAAGLEATVSDSLEAGKKELADPTAEFRISCSAFSSNAPKPLPANAQRLAGSIEFAAPKPSFLKGNVGATELGASPGPLVKGFQIKPPNSAFYVLQDPIWPSVSGPLFEATVKQEKEKTVLVSVTSKAPWPIVKISLTSIGKKSVVLENVELEVPANGKGSAVVAMPAGFTDTLVFKAVDFSIKK